MTPEDIHDLLVGAVPPLAAPPDRMARVRQRAARGRTLRVSASVLATAAVIGGAVLGAQAMGKDSPSGAQIPGAVQAAPGGVGVGECPQVVDLMARSPAWDLGQSDATIQAPLRSVTVCRYRHGEYDLSQPNGNADLLAGPGQGGSAAFAGPIQHYLRDLNLDTRVLRPGQQRSPSFPAGTDSPLPSDSPTTTGCYHVEPTQNVSVDVVYAVDAHGAAHQYLIMRTTCAGGDRTTIGQDELNAAVDQLLGLPY